jgi:hypothetical protein
MKTRFAALALLTLAASASVASAADSFLPLERAYDGGSTVDFETVRAAGTGMLEIYAYTGGEQGDLLGSSPVLPGVNLDVKVNIGNSVGTDLMAVLVVNGQVVDTSILPRS